MVPPSSDEPHGKSDAHGGSSSSNESSFLSSSVLTSNATRDRRNDDECGSCVRLLEAVLSNPHSKPAMLLQSMATTTTSRISPFQRKTTSLLPEQQQQQQQPALFQSTFNGVRVQIPVDPNTTTTTTTEAGLPPSPPTTTNNNRNTSLLRRWTQRSYWADDVKNSTSGSSSNKSELSAPLASLTTRTPTPALPLRSLDGGPLLATSATTTTAVVPPTTTTAAAAAATEWMSLVCRQCRDTGPEANARAFVMGPTPLSIVVCHNRLLLLHNNTNQDDVDSQQQQSSSSSAAPKAKLANTVDIGNSANTANSQSRRRHQIQEMDEILTHELMHIYDVRQLRLNLQSCQELAYSEVRAAREAECSSSSSSSAQQPPHHPSTATTNKMPNLFPSFSLRSNSSKEDPHKECVRTTAVTATRNLFGQHRANRCVQQVLDQAYNDHRPFRDNENVVAIRQDSHGPMATTAATTTATNNYTTPTATAADAHCGSSTDSSSSSTANNNNNKTLSHRRTTTILVPVTAIDSNRATMPVSER